MVTMHKMLESFVHSRSPGGMIEIGGMFKIPNQTRIKTGASLCFDASPIMAAIDFSQTAFCSLLSMPTWNGNLNA
jgi:hypothetical protein